MSNFIEDSGSSLEDYPLEGKKILLAEDEERLGQRTGGTQKGVTERKFTSKAMLRF